MTRILTVLCLVLALFVSAAPAHAEDSEDDTKLRPYWEMVFAGGMLMPLDQTADLYVPSLVGSMRIGWIGRLGLGFDMTLDYSPASRQSTPADDVYEVHLLSAGVMPRFTLGQNMLRFWLAAGGGMTFEHTEHTSSTGVGLQPTTNKYVPTSMGAAGLEVYAFSGVGLAVTGSYARMFGDLEYQTLNVTGGLAVTFH